MRCACLWLIHVCRYGTCVPASPTPMSPIPTGATRSMHSASLSCAWMLRTMPREDCDFPIFNFLVYTCVRADGGMDQAGNVTPRIARLQYWIRTVIAHRILVEVRGVKRPHSAGAMKHTALREKR